MIHDPMLAKEIQVRRDQRENENLIKRSEFYKVLSNLEAVDPQKTISFNVGDIIFREGDEPDAAWLIINGQVSVYHEANSNNPIAKLGPGQCFGERACLDKTKRNATVKALTHLEAIKISRDHFIQLYEISDELKSIISGLEFLYHLNQQGVALQYFSRKTGQISIERVYRLNNGRGTYHRGHHLIRYFVWIDWTLINPPVIISKHNGQNQQMKILIISA